MTPSELKEPVTQQDLILMSSTMKSSLMADLVSAQQEAREEMRQAREDQNTAMARLEARLVAAMMNPTPAPAAQPVIQQVPVHQQLPVTIQLPVQMDVPEAPPTLPGALPVDQLLSVLVDVPPTDTGPVLLDAGPLPSTSGQTTSNQPLPGNVSTQPTSPGSPVRDVSEGVVGDPSPGPSQDRPHSRTSMSDSCPPAGHRPEPPAEVSPEYTFRETMSTIRKVLGWKDVPEEEETSSDEASSWWEPRSKPKTKLATHLLVDDHLCRKMEKLQVNIKQGYPTKSSDPSPLGKGQFLRVPPRSRWYQLYQKPGAIADHPDRIKMWYQDTCKVNPTLSNISKGSAASSPASLPVPQDTVKKWEKATKDQTVILNTAAGIVKCQKTMHFQMESDLETLHCALADQDLSKSAKDALKSLSSALTFSARLTQAAAGCFRDLSDQVFVNHSNLILLRRDSYLDSLKAGITPDTLGKLRASPIHSDWLFSDDAIRKAEGEIKDSEQKPSSAKPASSSSSSKGQQSRYHPYKDQKRNNQPRDKPKSDAWRNYGRKDSRNQPKSYVSKPAKGSKQHK